jgi:hypothetical protein
MNVCKALITRFKEESEEFGMQWLNIRISLDQSAVCEVEKKMRFLDLFHVLINISYEITTLQNVTFFFLRK